jgi:hypothetical protein
MGLNRIDELSYRCLVVVLLAAIAYSQFFKAPVPIIQAASAAPAALSTEGPIKVEIVNSDENAIPMKAACLPSLSKIGACFGIPVEVKNRAADAVYENMIEPHPLGVYISH